MTPSYEDLLNTCTELINELHGYKIAHPSHEEEVINRARAVVAKGRRHAEYCDLIWEATKGLDEYT
jgi:hypothetical protein